MSFLSSPLFLRAFATRSSLAVVLVFKTPAGNDGAGGVEASAGRGFASGTGVYSPEAVIAFITFESIKVATFWSYLFVPGS